MSRENQQYSMTDNESIWRFAICPLGLKAGIRILFSCFKLCLPSGGKWAFPLRHASSVNMNKAV
jgi:hypothetical protein